MGDDIIMNLVFMWPLMNLKGVGVNKFCLGSLVTPTSLEEPLLFEFDGITVSSLCSLAFPNADDPSGIVSSSFPLLVDLGDWSGQLDRGVT